MLRPPKWIRCVLILTAAVLAAAPAAQDRVICRLSPGVQPGTLAAEYQMTLIDSVPLSPFALYEPPQGVSLASIKVLLAMDSRIAWAEDDADMVSPETQGGGGGSTIPAVGDRETLYALNEKLFKQISFYPQKSSAPKDVIVAVIDNGLSPYQPRLWERVIASANFIQDGNMPWDIPFNVDSNGNGDTDEMAGHGTMVTGIIDMMAPQAHLVIARVADSDGQATAWTLVKGFVFAVQNHANIANISLGSQGEIPALEGLIAWADENNMLVVAPIGNNGLHMALYPARYSKVLCVSGLQPEDYRASFSNWETTSDLAAPATGIKSTWWDGSAGVWSGTSFASPLVAGAIAASMPTWRQCTMTAMRQAVRYSGDSIDLMNGQYGNQLGWRLNMFNLRTKVLK